MCNKQLLSWIEDRYPDETPVLLENADQFLIGVGWQFSYGPYAIYESNPTTQKKVSELPEFDPESPCKKPLLMQRSSLTSPTREELEEWMDAAYPDQEFLIADGFEKAFVGLVEAANGELVAAFDKTECLEILVHDSGLEDYDCAEEYFDFNVTGDWVGNLTPMFIDTVEPEVSWVWKCMDGETRTVIISEGEKDAPMIRLYPPAPLFDDITAECQGINAANACGKQLTDWLNTDSIDKPAWMSAFVQVAGYAWVCADPRFPGMCLSIVGPMEDAQPQQAFSGMTSGEWRQRLDRKAIRNRDLLTALLFSVEPVAIAETANTCETVAAQSPEDMLGDADEDPGYGGPFGE